MRTLLALVVATLLAVQAVWATPFTLTKVSRNSGTDYATAFSLSLLEAGAPGAASLQLQNSSANAARLTRVFIQTPPGVIPGSATGDLAIQLAPVQVLGDFDVQLVDPGSSRLLVVRAVRDATGLSLDAARDLVDHAPSVITSGVGRGDALALQRALEDVGATTGLSLTPAFDVQLLNEGVAKLITIRAVQNATGVSLAEARSLVENAPSIIRAGVGRGDALALQEALADAGADVRLSRAADFDAGLHVRRAADGLTSFKVELLDPGDNRLVVVKAVKDLTGLSLAEAKALVDSAPATIKIFPGPGDASALQQALVDAGATAEVLRVLDLGVSPIVLPRSESFDVELLDAGGNRLVVVKIVRDSTGLILAEAKALVDSAPATIKTVPTRGDAAALQQLLVDAGATVEVRSVLDSSPGSDTFLPAIELALDYRGSSLAPDLLFTLPLGLAFDELLTLSALNSFRFGLEIEDGAGRDFYLASFSRANVGVAAPPAVLLLLAGLVLLSRTRRSTRHTPGQIRGGERQPVR